MAATSLFVICKLRRNLNNVIQIRQLEIQDFCTFPADITGRFRDGHTNVPLFNIHCHSQSFWEKRMK